MPTTTTNTNFNRVCHLVRAYIRIRFGRVELVRAHSRCCG